MPGCARWKLCMEPEAECWICNKYTLTYFFWNKSRIAKKSAIPRTQIDTKRIVDQLPERTDQKEDVELDRPFLYS